jgi:hypothetical protein
MYSKNCPICGIEIVYKLKSRLTNSLKRNSVCKSCIGKKISNRVKGVKKSDEHKQKLSDAKIGKKLSEEHKIKIGVVLKGKKRSEETKIRLSNSKLGDKNPAKKTEVKEKIRNTVNNLYKNNPEIKDKISKSLIKYFSENKKTLEEIDAFKEYRRIVDNLTSRNKKKLYEEWNGYDYYDGEYIMCNLSIHFNNDNYPSIDHKISVYNGFIENIDAKIVGDITNLCITKRKNNSKKGILNEEQFKDII